MKRSKKQQNGQCQKTPVSNLVRNATSGAYYARVRVAGKLIWKSPKTDRITVAQLRLGDFLNQERRRAQAAEAGGRGKITFEQALKTYEQRLDGDVSLKPRSKEYRRERIKALLKSWPELKSTDVRRISKAECLEWAGRFAKQASPSNFNNTVGTFRLILDVALEAGASYDNPARHIKRVRVRQKHLQLPSHENFLKLVDIIRKADGGYGKLPPLPSESDAVARLSKPVDAASAPAVTAPATPVVPVPTVASVNALAVAAVRPTPNTLPEHL